MANYFNTLPLRLQLEQLGKCDFMESAEFDNGVHQSGAVRAEQVRRFQLHALVLQIQIRNLMRQPHAVVGE